MLFQSQSLFGMRHRSDVDLDEAGSDEQRAPQAGAMAVGAGG
jgi:hypothetical protein